MSSPAERANSVGFLPWHHGQCIRVRLLGLGPCQNDDGTDSRLAGWPKEWATDPDIVADFPRVVLFAGRTCLETWRLATDLVERN